MGKFMAPCVFDHCYARFDNGISFHKHLVKEHGLIPSTSVVVSLWDLAKLIDKEELMGEHSTEGDDE